jgi:hypothetical protein
LCMRLKAARNRSTLSISREVSRKNMKPAPPPNVPGNTGAERWEKGLRGILSASKADLEKQRRRENGRVPGRSEPKRRNDKYDQIRIP